MIREEKESSPGVGQLDGVPKCVEELNLATFAATQCNKPIVTKNRSDDYKSRPLKLSLKLPLRFTLFYMLFLHSFLAVGHRCWRFHQDPSNGSILC